MFEEIVTKISSMSGIDKEEIYRMIEDKQVEMSGLISDEGAAYLVAKELGVELRRDIEKLNIRSIASGMQNVDFNGKITRMFPVREFKTDKNEGKVANIIISDKTGSIRMSFWNDEISKLENISVGDVIRIHGYVKDNMGQPEIRLGRKGYIAKIEDPGNFDAVVYERKTERSFVRDFTEGSYRSVRAPILQVFETNVFYEICPECKKRAKETDTGYSCQDHGEVSPDYGMIISGIIDDGTGNIRAVFFSDAAEKLLGMTVQEAKKLFDKKKKPEAVLSGVELGKEFILEGSVRRNTFFDRLEFVVNNVKPVDVKEEIKIMLEAKQ
jgi:ssDNA-binding replication factor A large subunit